MKGGNGERGGEQQFKLRNLIGQAVGKERTTDVVDAKKDVCDQGSGRVERVGQNLPTTDALGIHWFLM